MTTLQHTQILVDTAYDTGDGGLTGTRTAVEHEVVRDLRDLQALSLTLFLHLHKVCQRTYLLLHVVQTDQIVELLVGVTFQGLVHDDGVFLLHLFCLLGLSIGCFRLLVIIRKDGYKHTKDDEADTQAAATFEDLTHDIFYISHFYLINIILRGREQLPST